MAVLNAATRAYMAATLARTLYNATFDVQTAGGTVVETGVAGYFDETGDVQGFSGNTAVKTTVDAVLQCAVDDNIRPGHKIILRTINGATPAPALGSVYDILSHEDWMALGVMLECKLGRKL